MTNSTSDEREQRLKQIRERSESRKRVAGKFQWAQVSTQEWSDIDFLLSLLDGEAAGTNCLHHPQFPMNGTELECDGEGLRPDGMCAKCERINERIEAKIATIRQEERRAAFKDAIAAVPQVGVTFTEGYEEWIDAPAYRESVIAALEAAANETREDGDDG